MSCLSVSGFLQIPLNPALFFGSVLTMAIKLFTLSLLKNPNKNCPLLSNSSPFFSFSSILQEAFSSKHHAWCVSQKLFGCPWAFIFDLWCCNVCSLTSRSSFGLMWKVLRQRNVIASFSPMIWMQSQKMLALCHKLSRLYSAFEQQKFWVLGIYMFQQLKLCPNISRIWTIRKKWNNLKRKTK